MPELPEVETTRRGLVPHLQGRRVTGVVLRRPDLRWPIPYDIVEVLPARLLDPLGLHACQGGIEVQPVRGGNPVQACEKRAQSLQAALHPGLARARLAAGRYYTHTGYLTLKQVIGRDVYALAKLLAA